jgi:hypothetical protein
MTHTRPVCRGSWQAGNNCRACQRCLSTAPSAEDAKAVIDDINTLTRYFDAAMPEEETYSLSDLPPPEEAYKVRVVASYENDDIRIGPEPEFATYDVKDVAPRPDPQRLTKATGRILKLLYRDTNEQWRLAFDPDPDAAVNELNLAWQEAVARDR